MHTKRRGAITSRAPEREKKTHFPKPNTLGKAPRWRSSSRTTTERKILRRQRVSVDAITLDIIIKSIMLNQNEMKTLAFFIFANEIPICARFEGGANAHTANIQAEEIFFPGGIHLCWKYYVRKTQELLKRSQNKLMK
jgi:hypothetical protein